MTQRILLLTAAAAGVLALAACDKAQQATQPTTGAPIAALPLATAAPPPEQVAPYANQLPPAPPLPRARPRRAAYSYIDDAYALGDVFADSPPDYTVAYDGEYPWIWRTDDGAYRVVEDTPDGYREYYYYGDSDYPFLIRDPQYVYAYDGPELVLVYDSYGQPIYDYGPQVVDYGTRYFFRARRLYDAAIHEQRRAAYAADWRDNRAGVLAIQQQWAAQQQRNPDWQRVRQERVSAPPPRFQTWTRERAQRVAYAQRTAPVIAAAAGPVRPPREARPQMAVNPAPAGAPALPPGMAGRAALPPGMAVRDQAITEARARQAQHEAQLQAEQQTRLTERQGREQQRLQAQAQDRAAADQRRQAQLASRDQRQAQAVRDQQAEQQRRAEQGQRREAMADQARVREATARQAEQARVAERARRDQQAASERAAHEQQAQRAERQQQMASEHQAQAAQAQQARAAEQQARAGEQQQRQAQAAAQHAQQAAAQAGPPHGQAGAHPPPQPKPEKKDKPQP